MASLTLKEIPPDLLDRLRALAARERRSLAQQILVLVESGLARAEPVEPRAAAQIAAWRTLAGTWVSDRPFADEVADLRDARTGGRDVRW